MAVYEAHISGMGERTKKDLGGSEVRNNKYRREADMNRDVRQHSKSTPDIGSIK